MTTIIMILIMIIMIIITTVMIFLVPIIKNIYWKTLTKHTFFQSNKKLYIWYIVSNKILGTFCRNVFLVYLKSVEINLTTNQLEVEQDWLYIRTNTWMFRPHLSP